MSLVCKSFGMSLLLAMLVLSIPSMSIAGTTEASVKANSPCNPIGNVEFICGIRNVEDMAHLPGGPWIIGSSASDSIYAINAETKEWYPMEITAVEQSDSPEFVDCPGPRPATGNVSHGIGLRTTPDRDDELYVVNHGARESVEVFDVDLSSGKPALVWKGCKIMPERRGAIL